MPDTFEVLSLADIKNLPDPRSYAALKAYAATNLDEPPWYSGGEPHYNKHLDKVLWHGRQWAVTMYGIECLTHHYDIARDRLWENEDDWGWVNQIAGKNWTDALDFAEALRIARWLHDPTGGGA